MNRIRALFTTSLGKKYVMAISGLGLFLFVIAHMLGNLQIFLGPEAINRYGHFLQSTPEVLWPARIGLLVLIGLHLLMAATLQDDNTQARPDGYATKKLVDTTLASRTMLLSGLIVFAFIGYHLLHYTVQVPALNLTGVDFTTLHDQAGQHDVYRMMVTGFSNRWVASFYVVGVGLLCLHLSHGAASLFQSLGLQNAAYDQAIDRFAKIAAVLLFVGYISIPVAVQLGWVK